MTLGLLWITSIPRHQASGTMGGDDSSCRVRDRGYRGQYDGRAYEEVKQLFCRISRVGSEIDGKIDPNVSNAEESSSDSSTIQALSNVVEGARYTPEREDNERGHCIPSVSILHGYRRRETAALREKLQAMLTETGLE